MWQVVKSDISYHRIQFFVLLILPLLFTLFAISKTYVFEDSYFLFKYFWSMLVGLGAYLMIFSIWMDRIKEKRLRMLSILPVGIKNLALSEWWLGVAPILLIAIYLELLRSLLPDDWGVYTIRINIQLSMLFIALVTLKITRDLWFLLKRISDFLKIFISSIVVTIIVFISFLIIDTISRGIIKPLPFGEEEFYLFIWGFILSVISVFVFIHRKSYLS